MNNKSKSPKVLTLYNHKGGVSKTTTTFNLAGYLALTGKKVLMIDADPQCNLTQIALAAMIDEIDTSSATTGTVLELPGTSLLDALNQRIQGDAAFIDVNKIELNKASANLHLLRGSVELSSVEDDLAEAHIQRLAQRTNLMRTYVATGDMINRLANKHSFDYVLVDVGPSSGALTRNFFLACDYFFVPTAPDRFNVQAISTLSRIIDRWITEHSQVRPSYEAVNLPVKHGQPKFLGAIVQSFKVYKGKAKPAFKLWQDKIPVEIRNSLKPSLLKHDNSAYLPNKLRPVSTSIPDFGQLAPLMQLVGKPVFNISQNDTSLITDSGHPWVGNNWTEAKKRMKTYEDCFAALAKIVEEAS